MDEVISAFTARATEIGKLARDRQAAFDLRKTQNDESLGYARDRVADDATLAGGFGSVQYVALGELATAFGSAFNDPLSQTARDAARAAANAYKAAFTNKADNNGLAASMATLINLGNQGERARALLDSRLRHWQDQLASAKMVDDAAAKKDAMAAAQLYTSPPRKCPNPDGTCLDKDGKPFTPTHNFSPERVIPVPMGGGKVVDVTLPAHGATSRESQLYGFVRIVEAFGEAALTDVVADAWLHNGGKWEADSASLSVMANKASDAVAALITAHGGAGDAAFLQVASAVLARIASSGFKVERAANVTIPDTMPEPVVVTPPLAEPEPETVPETSDSVESDPFAALTGSDVLGAASPSEPETALGAALVAAEAAKAAKPRQRARKPAGGL